MEIKKETIVIDDYGDETERYSYWKFLLVPGCCEESIAARRPYLYLNFGEDMGEVEVVDDATPEWKIPDLEWDFIRSLADDFDPFKAYMRTLIPVKFCPFCGKKMPKVKRKENPPTPVHTDVGYHCGMCDERTMSCRCLPMTALFEVEE